MRRIALPALTLLAFAAAPAAARTAGKHDYGPVPVASPFLEDSRLPGPGIGREVRDLKSRIRRARAAGLLSPGEARRLDREARAIGHLARSYGRDGLSPSERAELETRARYLRGAVSLPPRGRAGKGGGRRGGV